MSAETQLYAVLSGRAGLVALVGDRIYPDAIPEEKALPAVVFLRASTAPVHTIAGALVCEDVHFAITAWATGRNAAEAVADEIAAALAASGNPKTDRSAGFDNEVGLYGVTIETDWFVAY